MFQFLKDVYNYFFPVTPTIHAQQTEYATQIQKYMKKTNNKLVNVYADRIRYMTIDYSKLNDMYSLLQQISALPYDIICIVNIDTKPYTYYNITCTVTNNAQYIANIMDMYYVYHGDCILLSRYPIKHTKYYILDENNNNHCMRITVKIADIHIHIYCMSITTVDIVNPKYPGLCIYDVLDDNYNSVPCIISGIIKPSVQLFGWGFNTGDKQNKLQITHVIDAKTPAWFSSTLFNYVNDIWCYNAIFNLSQSNVGNYAIETFIKINL
jgi:hypothetical protein